MLAPVSKIFALWTARDAWRSAM